MSGRFDVAGIGAAFAQAAVDSSKWPEAMDKVAEATDSFGAALVPVSGRLPNLPFSRSMGATLETYVRDGWVHRDARYRSAPIVARRGVASEFDFTTADEIASNPYYQEFLARFGLRWFAGVKVAAGDDFWACSIQRTIEQGPFSPGELKQLAALSPLLSSAAALARALGFARADAALHAFEISGKAVILLDRCGEVLRLNQAAQRLLGPDLQVTRRRLACANREASAALDRSLHAAVWSADEASLLQPVVLPRGKGRPIIAYLSRPPKIAGDALAPCQVVIVLADLEARIGIVETDLVRVFNLTPAEARLANRLVCEGSLETVADGLGIKYETARNVLKSVLCKTDTHRQGQLIALLARFAGHDRDRSAHNGA
jgi:DNA-binding CsgD family transcriptional regulator